MDIVGQTLNIAANERHLDSYQFSFSLDKGFRSTPLPKNWLAKMSIFDPINSFRISELNGRGWLVVK